MLLAQVLNDPDAADWVRFLNWGFWLVLATCIGAIIAGGATIAISTSTEHGRWGRHLIVAGLAGAFATAFIAAWIRYCYDLIVA
jgi:hypothetical protein